MTELAAPGQNIYLPGTYADEVDLEAAKSYASAMLFREWLKEIDPRLDIVWAKAGSKNIRGERWYIIRRNDNAPISWWMVNDGTPDEGYADPGPEHIERLRQMDSAARPGAWHEYRKRCEERERQGKRKREEIFARMREALEERLAHEYDTSISVSKGLVVPEHIADAAAVHQAEVLAPPTATPEAAVDDALAAGEIEDFKVEEVELPSANRAMRRKRNRALTRARGRLNP